MAPYGHIFVKRKTGEDGSCFPLLSRVCRFGKGHVCDIRIQRESVMEEHCLIEVGNDSQVRIKNLDKKCHTLVNGLPLSMDWLGLKHMDTIVIAERSFRWEYLKGSMFYSDSEQSTETNATPDCGKLSENNSVPTARRSLVPLQNVENGSSNIGPDLICFDSPLVVSDLKRQNRKSRSSMLNGNKLEASTKESPKVQTPKKRVSLRLNETEVPIFLSSPISLVNEEEISLQNKSLQSLPVAQYSEIFLLDRNSDAQENSHTSLKSSIEVEGKETKTEGMESDSTLNSRNGRRSSRRKSVALVVNTPIARNQNAESSVFSTYFEDGNMSIEKAKYTPNETSKMLAQTSVVIENTPRALRITSSSTTSSDDCSESRALLKRNRVSGLNMTHEGSSFSALTPTSGKSSRSKKSVALKKTKRDTNMCISDNPPFRSSRNSVKIVVVPPTPEQALENGEQVGVEEATNFIKFSVRKRSSIHVDLSGTNSQKSELAEQISNSPSKVYKDTGVLGGEDICGRSDKLSGFLCKGEEKRFELQVNEDKSLARDSVKNIAEVIGNGSFIMSETKKNTSCSRRMSSVQEYTQMDDSAMPMYSRKQDLSAASINLVTDTKEGEWSVNDAVNTSQRKSLRGRNSQSLRTPKTQLGKDLASVYWSNDTDSSDITKTPLPSDDEYASWLSQRTSVASTNEENPSSPITKRNLRQSTSKSCSQNYFENVREAMRKPLSISLNNSIPVPSRSKSIGGLSQTKEKTLSPVTRRSKRKSIATPYFVASIYNRLKTPATVGSKSFEVSEMGGNPKEFVTVRKKVHQVSTTEEMNSDYVDYLSDLSSNNSCLEGDGMDSLIQTSSLMLDQSNVSDGRGHLAEKSQVKSSWTSTPAVSNSTRKKRVTFGTSLCSVDLGQMPLTPMKPDLVSSVEVSTPTGEYFSENSAANATENTRDSLKKNKSLIKTPPKQGLPSAPKISDAGPNNIESVVESSYNSALDNTVTIMNTPSLLDKDRSIMSLGSLQSCESSIGDSPVGNKNHRRRCPIDSHDTPNTNISLSVIDAKAKFQQTNKRKSSGSLSATPSATQQGKKLEGQSSKKLNDEETTFTAPFIDVTLNPPGLPVESVTDVNGQEWNVTKDVPSRRESLRSRKSGNTSRANEHSSVFQDMTKTPVPSDEEYASWLSQISQRASLVSTNEANLSSPILQRSKRISNADSCASSCFINEDMVAKTPLSISPTQFRSKSIDKTSSAKAKASPAVKRNKRKSVQSLGTPCFVASIYNRLKTPTSVGSKGFEVSDTGSNSLEFVTLRKKVNQMSTTQEMNSNDVDYLSDLSRNNSCLEDGEMDSLMQTSSLMLDQSDVLDANGHLAEESQVKSSWTSTPAVSNSTRKKRVTFGASLCSEDFGQIPSTPQNFEVACSEDVNTPAKSICELSTASVTRSTRQSVTGKASITSCVKGNLEFHDNSTLRTGTLKSHFDSSAFNSILDDTSSLNSDTNVSELNTSQMSTRSLRSCKSVVDDGSSAAANTSKTESKRSSDARVSPSLVSTSWIFKREAEEMRKSSANTLVSELKSQEGVQVETSIESGKRKSMRRKSLENSSSNVTPQIEKVTRISVNATPDYSESMKYLLKTPAVITMKTKEVEETHGMINEKLPTTTPRTDSPHIERKRSFILSDLEQISPSTTSRRSLRLIRNSRSNSPECQQMENMASVRSSNEDNSSIYSESGKFASAEDEEEELDSHREGVQAASTKESGNSELASYKSSDGSKVTPQIRKVTRNSVNARPDNSESMKTLVETPAFNTLPVEGEEPAVIINEGSVIETPKMEVTHGDCRRSTTVTEVETISQSSSRSRKSLSVNKISTLDLSCVSKSSSVDANSSLLSDSASFTSALNMEDAYHTEEDDIVLNTPMTGKRTSTLRKSSIASSLKVTPLMRKGAKKSESTTPDYSESMRDLLKTPAVTAKPSAEDDLPAEITGEESQPQAIGRKSTHLAKRSSMFAEEEVHAMAINQSVNVDGAVDSEEGVALDVALESQKSYSSSKKSAIASSIKVTPLTRKVTRKSVSATPDFSESMKELMKTPAVSALPFAEEDLLIEVTNEESQTQAQRRNSSRCAKQSSMFAEEEVITSPVAINQSVNIDGELDSEEGVGLDTTSESGKRNMSSRRSSIASSFKVTPVIRNVMRKRVADTPDFSESMKGLMKSPAVTGMPFAEEDFTIEITDEESQTQTQRGNSSRCANRSSMFTKEEVTTSPMSIKQSVNGGSDPDSEEDVALDTTVESGKRRFSGKKSSIASSFKATPLMRKVTRKSVSATPDYSESMKDLLKTPAVSALQIPEENILTEDTNEDSQTQTQRRNSSRPAKRSSMFKQEEVAASPMPINVSANVEGDPDSEEDVALDTTVESGKRRSSRRKSSIASEFQVTPLLMKVTSKSVSATPDYSESMKDLLKTPAVSALQIPEEDILTEDTNEVSQTQTQRRNSSRPAKRSSMFTQEEVAASPMPINVSANVEGDPDSEEDVALDTTVESGKRRFSGRKSSIASSFKATPLMRKVTRKSVAATPDYSESMKDLLKTPAVSALQIPEEDILTEDTNEDSQTQTQRRNSSLPAQSSSMFKQEEVAASPMPINVSANVEGDPDSEEDVALDTTVESGKRRSSRRKSTIASEFQVTPLLMKVTSKSVSATPDYSESMKDLLKTPAASALQIPEGDILTEDTNEVSQTQTQRRNSSRPAKRSSMFMQEEVAASPMPVNVPANVEGDPDFEEDVALDTTVESGKRRSSGRKSSIASSFKATPLMRKVTRKSVSATPDYSESMKDLLKTPAVSALQILEENILIEDTNEDSQTQTQRRNFSRPAKRSSMFKQEEVAASPMPINVSANVEGDPDSEEDVALDTTVESGKRRSSRRKSSIASSFKATPLMRKVTRKSVSATPDYSESMKDLLKTPAVSALQILEENILIEDTNEDSQTQTQRRNSSRPAKRSSMFKQEEVAASPMPINVSANVEGDPDSEEDVALDTTVESGKRRSSRRKSSIVSEFQVTPLLMKVTSKSVSATPNHSDSTKDLLQTPDISVMPEYENISMEVITEESLAIDGKSLEKVTISNELQVFRPKDSTNENITIGESSELEMRKSSVMEKRSGQSLPNVSKDSPALVNVTLSSSEKFPIAETSEKAASDDNLQLDLSSTGRKKSASRVSSEGHENLKCMKKWLVPRSPTSRYSDLRGIKELYTHRSPLSSYADVSGLKELFASPMVHLSKGESVAKLVGEADNLNIEPIELDSCYGGKISSPYKNPVVLIPKLSHVALISSTEENEPVIPVKPLRSGRNKKVALTNLRPTRKMKDVEVVYSNSDLPQSEFSISHNGKENKLKTKQSSERKDAGSVIIVKDLPNLNECSSIPDAVVDSVILKSNLRNIAGQRGLRKHVQFDAQAAEMAEKKIEPVNEDGPSVTRKSSNRKSVRANPSGTSLRGQEPPIGNEKSSEKMQHEEEEANFAESRRRGNLRKRGMTEVLEKTVANSESNIPDGVSNTTKKGRVSKAEKQSSAVERSSRKKKADLLDEAVNSNEANADEIGDKGRGGSNKKADLLKAVEDKIEVESGTALSRRTRRTRGIERADDTVSVFGSEKTLSINTSSKDVNKTVNGLNASPEKQLQKKPNTGGGNQNSDEPAQQLTRRGKKVVKLEETSSGVDITADKMDVKSKSVSQKREELAKDIEDKVAVESAPVLGRQTRRKRGMEGVDETAGNTDADKIDGKSRSGAKKKAESMKNVEEKVDVESEPTLSRRTRRAKGIEGNNDTVVLGIKNVEPKSKISKVKSLKEETSEDINSEQETENKEAKDPKSKKKIGKEATFKPEKQTSAEKDAEMPEKENNGEDSVAEPAIPAEKEDQSNEKSNENKTSKPGRQTAKKDDAKSEKKGKRNPGVKPKKLEEKKEVPCEKSTEENVEHVAVASNERRTRRGNIATSLDSGIIRDAKESESSKGRNSKRSTKRVGDDDGGEEATLEKRSRRANNSVEKGDNVESEKKSSARSEVKKAVVVEPGVGVEVPLKLNTRRTKVTSCTGESSMKDSLPSSPERVQAEKLISEEEIISAIKKENATVERATRHKKNILSRKDEGRNAVPEAPVTYAKEEQDISKLKKAVSTVKKKDEEKKVPRGRNLRNSKNTSSDTCEITETKRPSRKRTATSSVSEGPSAVEEKSLPSQKKKESVSSLVVKTSKRIKLEEKDQDNGKEKVVANKVPRRVLRKR